MMGLNKNGQVFTMDMLIALFIFMLIFTSVIVFIYEVASVSNPYSAYYVQFISSTLDSEASSAINVLTGSQGSPSYWPSLSCPAIKTLGVMVNPYEASAQKLYNLTTLSKNSPGCLSELLRGGNSFNISAFYLNGTRVVINSVHITAGFPIPLNAIYIASIQRYVVLSPSNSIIRISYAEWLS